MGGEAGLAPIGRLVMIDLNKVLIRIRAPFSIARFVRANIVAVPLSSRASKYVYPQEYQVQLLWYFQLNSASRDQLFKTIRIMAIHTKQFSPVPL